MKKYLSFYKIVTFLASGLFLYLFIALLFNPNTFVADLGLAPSQSTAILARRASVLMLGFAFLLATSINLPRSRARRRICLSVGITFAGLAGMGTFELSRRALPVSILQAVIIESILSISFFLIFFHETEI